jgi:hypothetical protein
VRYFSKTQLSTRRPDNGDLIKPPKHVASLIDLN